jgi:hypothetical protein
MKDRLKTGFADRAAASNEAKKAMLAKFKPKPMVAAPDTLADREAAKQAELERVRLERLAAKESKRIATIEAEQARIRAEIEAEAAKLELVRSARKERQSKEKEESRLRRELRMQLYGKISANSAGGGNANYD